MQLYSMSSFFDLSLPQTIANAFSAVGFNEPTPVQKDAIPRIMAAKDLFIQSETGTGKTLAYLAPAFALAQNNDFRKGPGVLVLCPTQELAVQVSAHATSFAAAANLRWNIVTILGGSPLSRQEQELRKKAAVVIGTPGRLADLVSMGALKTRYLSAIILDEADRLFAPEIVTPVLALTDAVPESCLRILASATLNAKTRKKAAAFMRQPEATSGAAEGVLSDKIEHWVFYVDSRKRADFIRRFDIAVQPARCLVFASTIERVAKTASFLVEHGLQADAILATQKKETRRVALERFSRGQLRYLVTTDLSARGLDIANISHIISMDLPEEQTVYVHRAGRTGRAGAKGISIVLADGVELKRASKLALAHNFVFRCKVLEHRDVLEPPVEDFFVAVEAAEAEKAAYRRKKRADPYAPRR